MPMASYAWCGSPTSRLPSHALVLHLMPEAPSQPAAFAIFRYQGTRNLGDAIQTIALSRLLPGALFGIDRGTGVGPKDVPWVLNGWLGDNRLPVESGRCVFAGVFVAHHHNLPWLARSTAPVGARDPSTCDLLTAHRIAAEMIGCATLTFPRHDGPRTGTYAVDVAGAPQLPRGVQVLSHSIGTGLPWREQWSQALHALELYRRAEIVHTRRLHVALPCLAFGTPVVIHDPGDVMEAKRRFSLLRALGVPYGEVITMDVTPMAERYRAFLARHAKLATADHAPMRPD